LAASAIATAFHADAISCHGWAKANLHRRSGVFRPRQGQPVNLKSCAAGRCLIFRDRARLLRIKVEEEHEHSFD
jgi:hypothetical protein